MIRHSKAWPRGRDLLLGHRERLAGGDAHLLAHQVDAGHGLRDGVLHLDAGVHLEEEELLARDEVLQGAGAGVADGRGGRDRRLAHAAAQVVRDDGARGLLDQLLVAALHGAVALAQPDARPVRVGEHLDLDVPGVRQVPLEVDGAVGEEALALAAGALEGPGQLVRGQRHPEALAAAARRGLHRHGVADVVGDGPRGLEVGHRVGHARDDRHAGGVHQRARPGLGAHRVDRVGRRADPGDAGLAERPGEPGVLGQEAVPGVDRVDAGLGGDLEDARDVEVALARRAGARAGTPRRRSPRTGASRSTSL